MLILIKVKLNCDVSKLLNGISIVQRDSLYFISLGFCILF